MAGKSAANASTNELRRWNPELAHQRGRELLPNGRGNRDLDASSPGSHPTRASACRVLGSGDLAHGVACICTGCSTSPELAVVDPACPPHQRETSDASPGWHLLTRASESGGAATSARRVGERGAAISAQGVGVRGASATTSAQVVGETTASRGLWAEKVRHRGVDGSEKMGI
nr:unnamed protein product [Digitaria exilis]CAB3503379.1 unnamed protein product [Digitaria exilis]